MTSLLLLLFGGNPFASFIGKNYRRKISASGTKYEKAIWLCATFNNYGKKYCQSSIVPEKILEKLSAEVLKIPKFDEKIFSEKIKQIIVPEKGKLEFIFEDGRKVLRTWGYPSRSESWTEEMREMARNSELNRRKDEENVCSTSSNGNSGNN